MDYSNLPSILNGAAIPNLLTGAPQALVDLWSLTVGSPTFEAVADEYSAYNSPDSKAHKLSPNIKAVLDQFKN